MDTFIRKWVSERITAKAELTSPSTRAEGYAVIG